MPPPIKPPAGSNPMIDALMNSSPMDSGLANGSTLPTGIEPAAFDAEVAAIEDALASIKGGDPANLDAELTALDDAVAALKQKAQGGGAPPPML